MPKLVLNQYSFNRGALDPTLQGRPDLAWYQMGAKDVNNMILRPGGGVVKRPGFRFIDYAHSNDPDKPSRLVKFVFSTEQSYILEFSHKVIRIFMDGALVLYPPGHPREGRPAEIETGYAAEQLNDLDFWHYGFDYCQTSDVMYIVHRKHPPAQLIRFKDDTYAYDHHNWRLENIVFGGSIATPLGLTLTRRGNDGARYVVTAVAENNDESTVSNATTRSRTRRRVRPLIRFPTSTP